MRQLFVPACVCLMTWTGSTGPEATLSLDSFTGVSVVDKNHAAPIDDDTASAITAALPAPEDDTASTGDAPMAIATIEAPAPVSDVPIDIPVQADAAQTLQPRNIPAPPVAKPVVHRSRQEICDTLTKAAHSNDLPVPFFIRLLFQESGFRPAVVSRAGAEGIAQFMPETSAEMGLDNPFDPLQAIPASARLLRNLFQQFGNLGLAAAAYNAGPKRIQNWLSKKGKLPQETQGYVKVITGRPAETWKVAAAGVPAMRVPREAPCQEEAGLLAWNGPERIPVPLPSPLTDMPAAPVRVAAKNARRVARAPAKSRSAGKALLAQRGKGAKSAKGAVQLAASKHKKQSRRQVAQR